MYSETMIAKINSGAGMESHGRIHTAIIQQDGEEKVFYYTHIGAAHPTDTDRKAVENALGDASEYWMDCRLKVLRVSPDNVVFHGKEPEQDPTQLPFAYARHYNYTDANTLREGPSPKMPTMEPKPRAA